MSSSGFFMRRDGSRAERAPFGRHDSLFISDMRDKI